MNDFASFVCFTGDAFADDDSPPDEVLFVLIDFVGDFDDFTDDGVLRFGLAGDVFFTGDCFLGEIF